MATVVRNTLIPDSAALLDFFGEQGWLLVDMNQAYVERIKAYKMLPNNLEWAAPATELRYLRTYIFLRKPLGDESRDEALRISGFEPSLMIDDPQHDRWTAMYLHHPHHLSMFTRIRCGMSALVCYRPTSDVNDFRAPLLLSYAHVLETFQKYFRNITHAELLEETDKSRLANAEELLIKNVKNW